jgi:hypothetical protein
VTSRNIFYSESVITARPISVRKPKRLSSSSRSRYHHHVHTMSNRAIPARSRVQMLPANHCPLSPTLCYRTRIIIHSTNHCLTTHSKVKISVSVLSLLERYHSARRRKKNNRAVGNRRDTDRPPFTAGVPARASSVDNASPEKGSTVEIKILFLFLFLFFFFWFPSFSSAAIFFVRLDSPHVIAMATTNALRLRGNSATVPPSCMLRRKGR